VLILCVSILLEIGFGCGSAYRKVETEGKKRIRGLREDREGLQDSRPGIKKWKSGFEAGGQRKRWEQGGRAVREG
jgi:hypothetical protein